MAVFEEMVAYQEEVLQRSRIMEVLNRVIIQAKRASAPAQINIPSDFWTQVIEDEMPAVVEFERPAGGEKAIARAAELLSNAKFPVILNGGGVVIGGAIEDTIALAERLDAPVCCGYQHNDAFPGSHPLFTMGYYAGAFGNIPTIKFAAKLIALLPKLGKVYFSNSGSEANEKAFKIIRQLASIDPERKGKYKILFRDRDYHGTTIGALSASGQLQRKQDFGPFAEGFAEFPQALCYRCPFDKSYPGCNIDCARSLEDVVFKEGPDSIGGCIVEPITAGGGIIVPVSEYYPIHQEICNKYGIYLVMDEVVCGFGRTGNFWGFEQYDVDPDMVTMAKGLASSYMPLSATVTRQEIYDKFLCDPADPETGINYFRDIST